MIQQYYIKEKGRYKPAGYSIPDMPEGIYWKQKTEYGSKTTSVLYLAGKDIVQPLDIQSLLTIMSKSDELSSYIGKLMDEDSEELNQAKEDQGGYVQGPLKMYNWSPQDLAVCILRFIFNELHRV